MLVEQLAPEERRALHAATMTDDGAVRDMINRIVWVRLLERWDQVVWKFWVLKTLRYRDLEGVWTLLFGSRPAVLS